MYRVIDAGYGGAGRSDLARLYARAREGFRHRLLYMRDGLFKSDAKRVGRAAYGFSYYAARRIGYHGVGLGAATVQAEEVYFLGDGHRVQLDAAW
jgi:hypothetical protein